MSSFVKNPENFEDRLELLRKGISRIKGGSIDEIQGQKGMKSNLIVRYANDAKNKHRMIGLDSFLSTPQTISQFIGKKTNSRINEANIGDAEIILNFLNKKYEELIPSLVEKNRITAEQIKGNELTNFFIESLRKAFYLKFNSQKDKNIVDYISKRKGINPESVDEFITAFPSYFCSIITKTTSKDEISDLIQVTNLHSYNYKSRKSNSVSSKKISDYKGILVGHSLSPLPDNISLIMEMGKLKRLETVYGKSSQIIVTNEEYANYNEISVALKNEGFTSEMIKRAFRHSKKYRMQFYQLCGYTRANNNIEVLSVESKSQYIPFTKKEFVEDTDYYVTFADKINNLNTTIYNNKDNVKHLLTELLTAAGEIESPDPNDQQIDEEILSHLDVENNLLKFPKKHKLPLHVLYAIKDNFDNISSETIYYTFLQRYAQHNYTGFLKFGNKSEIKFDSTYAILDSKHTEFDTDQSIDNHELHAYYYDHYRYILPNDKCTGSIPYYTPNKKMFENFGKDIDAVRQFIPLVTDNYSSNEDGYNKIVRLSEKLPLTEIAKQTSDLLSFAVYVFQESNDYWDKILPEAKTLSPHFESSLINDMSIDQQRLLQEFGHQALTIMAKYVEIPYYYYPFLIYLKSELKKNKRLEKGLRNFYMKLVCITMQELQNNINYPQWTIQ